VEKFENVVVANSEVLNGAPVFAGTRVPVINFLDSLEAGDSIDLFLFDFPTVGRNQVVSLLEHLKREVAEFATA
jgi:uncharacterized protein (DUF433 family)